MTNTHSRFSRNTSRDDYDVCASQSLCQAVIWSKVTRYLGGGGNMGEISSNTRGVDNIEKTKLTHGTGQANATHDNKTVLQ